MNNNDVLNVVFSTDSNYHIPTYIAIYSLLSNYCGKRDIHIYILYDNEYTQQQLKFLEDLKVLADDYELTISYIDMNQKYNNVKISNSRISKATLYRLSIPHLLKNVKKCLYLDSDIVVEGDISELYDIELEGKPLAAVKDIYVPVCDYQTMCDSISIPSMNTYFNAGVLLLDLQEIRRLQIYKEMEVLGEKCHKYPFGDQDILNVLFYDRIKLISLKYNMAITHIFRADSAIKEFFADEDFENALRNPLIIHYISYMKPWIYAKCIGAKYWWKYVYSQKDEIIQCFIEPYVKKQHATLRDKTKVMLIYLYANIKKGNYLHKRRLLGNK